MGKGKGRLKEDSEDVYLSEASLQSSLASGASGRKTSGSMDVDWDDVFKDWIADLEEKRTRSAYYTHQRSTSSL